MRARYLFFCYSFWFFLDHCPEGARVTSRCPPAPVHYIPCRCEHSLGLNLVCDDLHDPRLVDLYLRASSVEFTVLAFLRSSMDHIPGEALNKAKIKVLYLRNVTLESLFAEGFQGAVHVKVLTTDGISFTHGFPWPSLSTLQDLRELTIRKHEIPKIDPEFMKFVSTDLARLIMSETGTEEIVEKAFLKLVNLKDLQVIKNNLHRLRRDILPVPTIIETLDFNNNKLASLPSDFFTNMPQLENVGLSGNYFSTLSEATFSRIWFNTSYVTIRDNPIKCDCLLEWIVKKEMIPYLRGNCLAPKRLYGEKLSNLKRKDFEC